MIGRSIELYTAHHSLDISEQSNNQKIFNLWQQFMVKYYSQLKPFLINENIISLEETIADNHIRKWAMVEIDDENDNLSKFTELEILTLNSNYFGFTHTGSAIQFNSSFQKSIEYLKTNKIQIDERYPRLEIMHNNYRPDDSLSKEQFWIPIIC